MFSKLYSLFDKKLDRALIVEDERRKVLDAAIANGDFNKAKVIEPIKRSINKANIKPIHFGFTVPTELTKSITLQGRATNPDTLFDEVLFENIEEVEQVRCTRCNGTGKIRQFQHVEAGKCFKCNGSGFVYK